MTRVMVVKSRNSGRFKTWLLAGAGILAAAILWVWWFLEHFDINQCGEGRPNPDPCELVITAAMAVPFLILPALVLCAPFALAALVFFFFRWLIRKLRATPSGK